MFMNSSHTVLLFPGKSITTKQLEVNVIRLMF
jgi:hypothetical protein